jgi:SAM-dependent methyltransferase
MDLSEEPAQSLSIDERHPWEVSRFKFFRRVVADVAADRHPKNILDAGAGDAWFSQVLGPSLPVEVNVTCWDAYYTPDRVAAIAADAGPRYSFVSERPSETFDLVLLLDVLEHVEDDAGFLGAIVRENLAPGGSVLVSVPAWQRLFTNHDLRLRHHRRYAPAEAASLLEGAGLTIVRRGGLFHSLLVPRALGKLRETLIPPETSNDAPPALRWRAGALARRAVDLALAVDNEVSWVAAERGAELPGLSWWALCKKNPETS